MSQLNLSHDERLEIVQKYLSASSAGKSEEASKIIRNIPLPAHLAMATKDALGIDFLINSGFDLSDAEVRYGSNWLNQ